VHLVSTIRSRKPPMTASTQNWTEALLLAPLLLVYTVRTKENLMPSAAANHIARGDNCALCIIALRYVVCVRWLSYSKVHEEGTVD